MENRNNVSCLACSSQLGAHCVNVVTLSVECARAFFQFDALTHTPGEVSRGLQLLAQFFCSVRTLMRAFQIIVCLMLKNPLTILQMRTYGSIVNADQLDQHGGSDRWRIVCAELCRRLVFVGPTFLGAGRRCRIRVCATECLP